MSTLNLKQYLAKIDTLLEDEYYDEAIFHSRHILSLFPKNLATYRRLGRAEIGANRWDDASTTLRRILSFAPDDKIAHIGMSKVYQRTQKKEEALWHLERAYEQDPNNQDIIEELRDLYIAYKKVSHVRLQLTAGAVARQYTKNQLYPQAIKVLKDALRQTPQRVDLRLALARVYRESGDIIAAAETALDVLDILPDCLDANYIMTEVWLSEQRPSDAQRYLSVVEALDPYLAMRLAQGKPAPDDLIELPEADYKKAGQILSDQNPDWLNQLDGDKVVDLGGNWSDAPIDDPTLKLRQNDDLLDLDLGDDDLAWLNETTHPASDEETVVPENSRKHTGLTGMLTKFDKGVKPEKTPTEQIHFDDLFTDANVDDNLSSSDADIMAWLTNATPENMVDDKPAQLPPVPHDKDDPMAWLKASGIEILDDSLSEDMLRKTKAPTEALNPHDPMAWLKASGIELSDEPAGEQFTPYEKIDSTTLKSQDDDPMAWLRDSDIEFVDDEPVVKNFVDDDLPNDEADPMAWLKDSGIELIDDEVDNISSTPMASTTSSEWDDSSFLDEMLSMEELTGQTGDLASVLGQPSTTPQEDWQDTMNNSNDNFPSWLSDTPPSDDDDFSFDKDQVDDSPDWLMMRNTSETNFDANTIDINLDWGDDKAVSDDETPDWLMDMKPVEQPASTDEFDFLSDESAQTDADFTFAFADDQPSDAEDTPDWLMGVSDDVTDTAQETDADFAFAFADDQTPHAEDTPDWLMGVSDDVTDTAQETDADFAFAFADDQTPDAEDTPDWLMGVSDVTDTAQETDADFAFAFADDQTPDAEDTPDWLMGVSDDVTDTAEETDADFAFAFADDQTPDAEDTPDWLMGVSDVTDTTQETDADFAFAFADDQPSDAEDTPDWLMGVSDDVTDTAQETDADFAFAFADDQPSDAEDTPDWLMGVSDDVTDTAQETDADFAFAFADDQPSDAEDTPDWLMGVSDDVTDTAQETDADFAFAFADDQPPDAEDTPDWLMGVSDDVTDTAQETDADFTFAFADDQPSDAEDTPDWLMGVSDVTDTAEETDADFAFAFADDQPSDAEDTPDWLMGVSDDVTDTVSEEEVELDFLSADLDDEALVTEDAPDWLMNARPEADDSDEKALDWLADDEEPVEEEMPSWLSALSDDKPSADEKFGWVMNETEMVGEFDETVAVMANVALSLGDSVDISHTPAENAPDWLNALVPGLDIDFDADEDAPVEQSFADSAAVAYASANFGWLMAIVEAEVNQPPMTMPSASTIVKPAEKPAPTTASSPRKWSFSRPPAWLNRGSEQQVIGIKPVSIGQNQATTSSTPSTRDDDFEEMDFEDDDDLPAWLRDDNDDEPDFLRDNF